MPPPPASSQAFVVEAQKLGRRQALRWTLKDVNLQVPQGQIVMLAGANGSGKTTLLRVLSGAWTISRGKLKLFGQTPGFATSARMLLLSHADHLYDDLSAWENMQLLVRLCPRDRDPMAILSEVGLAGRLHEPIRAFSAGMRKRLALARLFYKQPDLVLLDEPYSQLDPAGATLIDQLFLRLRSQGTTALVATHQVHRVSQFVDRALLMVHGELKMDGNPKEICQNLAPGSEEGAS